MLRFPAEFPNLRPGTGSRETRDDRKAGYATRAHCATRYISPFAECDNAYL